VRYAWRHDASQSVWLSLAFAAQPFLA
jgi:hypothetical protein